MDALRRAMAAQGKVDVAEVLRQSLEVDLDAPRKGDPVHPHVEPVDQRVMEFDRPPIPECDLCASRRTIDRGGNIACPECSHPDWSKFMRRDMDGSDGWPTNWWCCWLDQERWWLARLNGSRAKGDAPDVVFWGAAQAERDFAMEWRGAVWMVPLKPRAQTEPDVRLPDGREVDVKNQQEMVAMVEQPDGWLYFAQHKRLIAPGWRTGRTPVPYDSLFPSPKARSNLVYDLRNA